MDTTITALFGAVGTAAFFAFLAFAVWIDYRKKKDESDAAHRERMKALELGHQPLDAEIARAKAYASAAWAAGLIGLLVPLAVVSLAVLGWAVAVLLLLTGPGPSPIILSGALVVAGGLLIAYSERRLCEELAHQYKHIHGAFARGREAFQQVLKDSRIPPDQQMAQAQRLLRELGREALSENAQWLILRRTRPFDVVVH